MADYVYSVGRIRSMERFLIKDEVFKEAIGSDLKGALRLFVDAGLYTDELVRIKDSRQLEEVLDKELRRLRKITAEMLSDKKLAEITESDSLNNLVAGFKDFPGPILRDYIRYLVDMHNLKSFLRLYMLKEPVEALESVLTYEGFLRKKDFLEFYRTGPEALLHKLEYVHKDAGGIDYAHYLGEAVKKTLKDRSFVSLEKEISNFLIQQLKSVKYATSGPEPVLGYYFARRNEISLIRMVILAKLNNMPAELAGERLNYAYA